MGTFERSRLARGVLVAALLVTASCTRPADDGESIDLIVVAGQSNAVGYDTDPARLPPDESDARVMFWWRCGDPPPDEFDSTSGGRWTTLQAQPKANPIKPKGNFRAAAGGFGPEVGLARTLAAGGRTLAIVKTAWNGSSIETDWNPDGGASFRSLVEEVRLAREAARSNGIDLRLRALAWVQGEADAVPRRVARYEEALAVTMSKLREALGAPGLPLLLGVNVHYGDVKAIRPRMATIVRAQKAVAARLGASAYVDTGGASLANAAHFDSAGTLEVGRRFAHALVELERTGAKAGG